MLQYGMYEQQQQRHVTEAAEADMHVAEADMHVAEADMHVAEADVQYTYLTGAVDASDEAKRRQRRVP